jgi:hypothetical protein
MKKIGFLLICSIMIFAPVNSWASIMAELDTRVGTTDYLPIGSPPWLTATAANAGANTVQITLQSNSLQNREHVGMFYFNVADSFANSLVFSGTGLNNAYSGLNSQKFQYFNSFFDAKIVFNGDYLPKTANPMVFTVSAPGLTESAFDQVDSSGEWIVAAWIEDIDRIDEKGQMHYGLAGGIGAPMQETPVPEPSSLLLMGFGGIITVFLKRRRKV